MPTKKNTTPEETVQPDESEVPQTETNLETEERNNPEESGNSELNAQTDLESESDKENSPEDAEEAAVSEASEQTDTETEEKPRTRRRKTARPVSENNNISLRALSRQRHAELEPGLTEHPLFYRSMTNGLSKPMQTKQEMIYWICWSPRNPGKSCPGRSKVSSVPITSKHIPWQSFITENIKSLYLPRKRLILLRITGGCCLRMFCTICSQNVLVQKWTIL